MEFQQKHLSKQEEKLVVSLLTLRFELTHQEFVHLRSQIETSSVPQWEGARCKPMSFTEQGVAMLSSVLRSKRAVHVNIEIRRAFVRLRQMLSANKELERKLADNILTAKRADPNATATASEAEIDARVAHLYELTEEEYSLILSALKLSNPFRVAALNFYRDIGKGVFK